METFIKLSISQNGELLYKFMPLTTYGDTEKWLSVGARIPPEDYERLKKKYPKRCQVSAVIRALIQMHLNGKIFLPLKFEQSIKP